LGFSYLQKTKRRALKENPSQREKEEDLHDDHPRDQKKSFLRKRKIQMGKKEGGN